MKWVWKTHCASIAAVQLGVAKNRPTDENQNGPNSYYYLKVNFVSFVLLFVYICTKIIYTNKISGVRERVADVEAQIGKKFKGKKAMGQCDGWKNILMLHQ